MPDKLPGIKGLGYSVFMSVTQASLRTVLQAIKKQKERKKKKAFNDSLFIRFEITIALIWLSTLQWYISVFKERMNHA